MSILRRITDFLLQNRLHAMGVAFVCAYIPLLGSLGILVTGLVTLRKGALEGFFIALAATIPYILKYFMGINEISNDVVQIAYVALILTITSNLLVWGFATLLRRYNNWSMVLEYSVLLGIVVIGIIHIVNPDIQSWWSAQLMHYFDKTSAMVSGLNTTSTEAQVQVVDMMKAYATGLVAVSLLLNVMLQLGLARWWQALMFNPGGLSKELRQIRMSHVMGVLFIIGFVLSYFGNDVAMDMMPLLYGMFCAAGLSLAHCYFNTRKNSWVWLLILYLLIIWAFPFSIICIAIVAWLDVWLNIRKRFVRPA